MNDVHLKNAAPPQEVFLGDGEMRANRIAANHSNFVGDLIHDLRQPLEVIESLAYYLEITCSDVQVCAHLHKIQAMVMRTNQILERSVRTSLPAPQDC